MQIGLSWVDFELSPDINIASSKSSLKNKGTGHNLIRAPFVGWSFTGLGVPYFL